MGDNGAFEPVQVAFRETVDANTHYSFNGLKLAAKFKQFVSGRTGVAFETAVVAMGHMEMERLITEFCRQDSFYTAHEQDCRRSLTAGLRSARETALESVSDRRAAAGVKFQVGCCTGVFSQILGGMNRWKQHESSTRSACGIPTQAGGAFRNQRRQLIL